MAFPETLLDVIGAKIGQVLLPLQNGVVHHFWFCCGMYVQGGFIKNPVGPVGFAVLVEALLTIVDEGGVIRCGVDDFPSIKDSKVFDIADLARLISMDRTAEVFSFRLELGFGKCPLQRFDLLLNSNLTRFLFPNY